MAKILNKVLIYIRMWHTLNFLLSSFFPHPLGSLSIFKLYSFAVYEGISFPTFHLQPNHETALLPPAAPAALCKANLNSHHNNNHKNCYQSSLASPRAAFIAPKSVLAEASFSLPHGKREEGLDTASVTIVQFFFFSMRPLGFAHTWEQHLSVCLRLVAGDGVRQNPCTAFLTAQPLGVNLIWTVISVSWHTHSGKGAVKSNGEIQHEATESCNLKFQYYYYH